MPTVALLRGLLAAAGAAGVVLLVLATSATIIEIKVLTTGDLANTDLDTTVSGWDRHGPAFVIIAVFALLMLAGAVTRRARPAMAAVAACGAITLAIAALDDGRHIHDTGQVGQFYADATADAASGFYMETLGGALLLIAGGGLLVLAGADSGVAREPRRRRRETEPEPEPADEPPATGTARGDDWFS